jgi:hypothetical protein
VISEGSFTSAPLGQPSIAQFENLPAYLVVFYLKKGNENAPEVDTIVVSATTGKFLTEDTNYNAE